jgi:flagellar basal-body rod modification protein FlgD
MINVLSPAAIPATPPTSGSQTSSTSGSTSSSSTSSSSSLGGMATEQTFLQLLVAQLENQDPDNPQDGTQFVSQLAQFSSLEQQIQMRTDLDSINKDLGQPAQTTGTQGTS